MSFSGFKQSFRAFLDRIDMKDQLDFMSEQKDLLDLKKAKSCLSIGPGFGDMDCLAIKTLMPSLKTYTAVEKDDGLFQDLNKNFKMLETELGHPLLLNLYQMDVEEWEGPAEPVDVILLFHVIYYMKNPEALLKKCKSWLVPGGTIWLTYSDVGNLFKHVNNYFDIDSITSITPVNVEELIKKLGVRSCHVSTMNQYVDLSDINNSFVSFCLYREANTEDEKEFIDMVQKEYGDDKVDRMQVQMYICKL